MFTCLARLHLQLSGPQLALAICSYTAPRPNPGYLTQSAADCLTTSALLNSLARTFSTFRAAPHCMDTINVEAAFVILSNATDPELCNALQQNTGLRRRIQRILEHGPPPGSSARLQSAPQHRTAQQTPQGWPDSPGPAMSSMPATPSAQFGGTSHAPHSSARSWADMSEQSDRHGAADWSQDPWEAPLQQSAPILGSKTHHRHSTQLRHRKARASKARLPNLLGQWQAKQGQMGQCRLDGGQILPPSMGATHRTAADAV